nr:MAG: hypothetical protein [Microviridae sp.]
MRWNTYTMYVDKDTGVMLTKNVATKDYVIIKAEIKTTTNQFAGTMTKHILYICEINKQLTLQL